MSLNRRQLIIAGPAAVACSILGAPAALGGTGGNEPDHHGTRPPRVAPDPFLDALTIPAIHELFRRRRLSARELTDRYLARIAAVDPVLGAVIVLDPTAKAQASAADRRRRDRRIRGPLDGIPVLLKDNIDTAHLQTTAGSRALLGAPPRSDAALVTALRAAGAVILGKANLSEWANFRSNTATSGWSGVGGQTNSPYVLDRNPDGSSAGPAVGVAAALCQVAVGTETNGSIVGPSGQNAVVGLKPSLGLVSRTGVVPITPYQDTAGPMARHVIDAAILLGALRSPDRRDPVTLSVPGSVPHSFTDGLTTARLDGRRIGVWRQAGIDADTDAVVQLAVEVITGAGGVVVELEVADGAAGDLSFTAMKSEFPAALAEYLATRRTRYRTLQDLVDFDLADPIELSKFDQSLFLDCLAAPPASDPAIVAARQQSTELSRTALDGLLEAHRLDAIMSPANSPAWLTTYGSGDAFLLGSSGPAARAGYPNLSVPAGFAGELPVGVNFMGRRWDDHRLLQVGTAFERAAHARRMPRYLPSIGE